jgi:hypothetical protein
MVFGDRRGLLLVLVSGGINRVYLATAGSVGICKWGQV